MDKPKTQNCSMNKMNRSFTELTKSNIQNLQKSLELDSVKPNSKSKGNKHKSKYKPLTRKDTALKIQDFST